MANMTKFCLIGFTLAYFISSVLAFSCYTCWSKADPACYEQDTLQQKHVLECSRKDNVCKKITTDYYRIEKRGQKVVYSLMANITSRICGIEDWTGCRRNQGAASWTEECVCRGHKCNTATQTHTTTPLIVASTLWTIWKLLK